MSENKKEVMELLAILVNRLGGKVVINHNEWEDIVYSNWELRVDKIDDKPAIELVRKD